MKLCAKRDPLLKKIEDDLGANLIRTPRAIFQPYTVIAKNKRSISHEGDFKNLLKGETPFPLSAKDLKPERVADLSGKETIEIDSKIGMEMLQGFLKGFLGTMGVSIPNFTAALKSAQTLTYAFEEVFEKTIDNGALGKALSGRFVDKNNPGAAGYFGEDKAALLLIKGVYLSQRFQLNVAKSTSTDIGAEITALADSVGKIDARFKVTRISDTSVAFQGENPLPFAFTCIQLKLNEEGKVIEIQRQDVGKYGSKGMQDVQGGAPHFEHILLTEGQEMLEFGD